MLSLLQRLNRLKLGGAFLFADVMEPSTESARRHFATAWKVELFTHTREQQVAMFFSRVGSPLVMLPARSRPTGSNL